jgi:hypothetical protein
MSFMKLLQRNTTTEMPNGSGNYADTAPKYGSWYEAVTDSVKEETALTPQQRADNLTVAMVSALKKTRPQRTRPQHLLTTPPPDYYEQLQAFTRGYGPLCDNMPDNTGNGGNLRVTDENLILHHTIHEMATDMVARKREPKGFSSQDVVQLHDDIIQHIKDHGLETLIKLKDETTRDHILTLIPEEKSVAAQMPRTAEIQNQLEAIKQFLQSAKASPESSYYELYKQKVLAVLPDVKSPEALQLKDKKAELLVESAIYDCTKRLVIGNDYDTVISQMQSHPKALDLMIMPYVSDRIAQEVGTQTSSDFIRAEEVKHTEKDFPRRAGLIKQCLQTEVMHDTNDTVNYYDVCKKQVADALPHIQETVLKDKKTIPIVDAAIYALVKDLSYNGLYKDTMSEMHDKPADLHALLAPFLEQQITIESRAQTICDTLQKSSIDQSGETGMEKLRKASQWLIKANNLQDAHLNPEEVLQSAIHRYVSEHSGNEQAHSALDLTGEIYYTIVAEVRDIRKQQTAESAMQR